MGGACSVVGSENSVAANGALSVPSDIASVSPAGVLLTILFTLFEGER